MKIHRPLVPYFQDTFSISKFSLRHPTATKPIDFCHQVYHFLQMPNDHLSAPKVRRLRCLEYPSLPLVGRGPIQPAIVQKKNGNLAAFLRDSGDYPPRVHYSESSDLGESWTSSVKLDIPNTASVELLVLKDGRWAFVGNDIPDGRNQLVLWLSDDEGKTWKWKTYLENMEPKAGGFSYPCLIQTSDGLLHISYSYHLPGDKKSIKYVVVNPSKI